MDCASRLDFACTEKAEGDASCTATVVTNPMRFPRALADSMTVLTAEPSGVTPAMPLLVLYPVDIAVAAAAEAVTNESAECVVSSPSAPVLKTTSVTANGFDLSSRLV